METNLILAGVGGQGILSISYVIDMAAVKQGLNFKQSEVHGMSQRGGAVQSHLRVSDHQIFSDLVPIGRGTMILSVEPLESLRYVEYLSLTGMVITSTDPYVNIADYPEIESLLDSIASLPHHLLIPADRLARQAGSGRAQNMVLLGAASPFLGIRQELLEEGIREAFARKGDRIQKINIDAFHAGRAAGQAYCECREAGIPSRATRLLISRLLGGQLQSEAVPLWKELLTGPTAEPLMTALNSADSAAKVTGTLDKVRAIKAEPNLTPERIKELLFS